MSKKIFLSYSLSDREAVESFKEQMAMENKTIEFDEYAVVEGSEHVWKETVEEKIKNCNSVLCLFGHSTWESQPVKWEVEQAVKYNKQTLAVKLRSTVFMIPKYIEENHIKIFENDPSKLINEIN